MVESQREVATKKTNIPYSNDGETELTDRICVEVDEPVQVLKPADPCAVDRQLGSLGRESSSGRCHRFLLGCLLRNETSVEVAVELAEERQPGRQAVVVVASVHRTIQKDKQKRASRMLGFHEEGTTRTGGRKGK